MVVSRSMAIVTAVLFAASLGAAPARAQSWSVTPYLGYYLPTGDLLSGSATFPDFPGISADITAEGGSGLGFGGMIGRYQPSGLGFEFGIGYFSSDVEATICLTDGIDEECDSDEESGNVIPLVGRVFYRFSPATARTQFYGAAGLAYLLRGGDAWDVDGVSKNVFGGTLAAGVLHPISPTMKLRVELSDFLYSSKPFDDDDIESTVEGIFLEDAEASAESNFKNDFTLSVGVMIPFGS